MLYKWVSVKDKITGKKTKVQEKLTEEELAKRGKSGRKWPQIFNPVFVHGGDAFIVWLFYENMIQLCHKKNDPDTGWFTNHDNFFISIEYALLLDDLVKKAYIDFYKANYLSRKSIPMLSHDLRLEGIITEMYKVDQFDSERYLKVEDLDNPLFIKH
jgi:hypothetical protein